MADLHIDPQELRPIVHEIVSEVISIVQTHRGKFDGRLAISEPEAAGMLGLNTWQLRDLRLSGKIGYCRIVGNRVRYTLDHLLEYLRSTSSSI